MWVHNLNPVLLKLGFLEIRYYGLVYVLGFFISVWWMLYLRKKGKLELSKEGIWDFVFYLMLGVLIGSRVFEIFWEPGIYLRQPWELLMVWHGGMSFHGGLVGIGVAAWLYCKKKKINLGRMADILALPAILALALGRITNFINGELVGRIWSGQWCVVFPGYNECRHPSTLYAAGKRFLVLGWLVWLSFKDRVLEFRSGFIFWNFVFFEGLGRIIVDFYRENSLWYGFSMGQWFSSVMVVVALVVFFRYYRKDWKKLWN
ncbi:prolipoprotein diacylglyceryl transferase [Candidatus Woesearchaeota archaeon]|nr:prolipoprotein diacylglyceryl transferase [Candidatus Woesearchaeota archaeon]